MEPRFVSRVKETFYLEDRGISVLPGVPYHGPTHHIQIGDAIEVRKPDGGAVRTKVRGIEMINSVSRQEGIGLVLDHHRKEDIPIGAELWHLGRASK